MKKLILNLKPLYSTFLPLLRSFVFLPKKLQRNQEKGFLMSCFEHCFSFRAFYKLKTQISSNIYQNTLKIPLQKLTSFCLLSVPLQRMLAWEAGLLCCVWCHQSCCCAGMIHIPLWSQHRRQTGNHTPQYRSVGFLTDSMYLRQGRK